MNKKYTDFLNIISSGTESLFDFLIDRVPTKHNPDFSAGFEPVTSLLSSHNYGFSMDGRHNLTVKDSYKNALICGQSGAGKSSAILAGSIRSLSRGKSSMCVMDCSGELYLLFSAMLATLGYNIYVIDFSSDRTDAFNPLLYCKNLQDIQRLAHTIISNSNVESKNDLYWSISAEMALTVFLRYLIFDCPPELATLGNAVRIIEKFIADPTAVDVMFSKCSDSDLVTSYKALVGQGERLNQSIMATLRAGMKMFNVPSVVCATSVNTIPFADFRHTPSVLFISTPLMYLNFFAPITALLFSRIFDEIMSKIPGDADLSIFNLMDEMLVYKLEQLPLVLSNCRKFRSGCMCLVQGQEMIRSVYSEADAHAIKTNCFSHAYLPTQPPNTCRELSELLGRYSYKDATGTHARKLLEPDEIRHLKETLFLIGSSASKGKLYPYYEDPILRKLTALPPLPFPDKLPKGMPPVIQF